MHLLIDNYYIDLPKQPTAWNGWNTKQSKVRASNIINVGEETMTTALIFLRTNSTQKHDHSCISLVSCSTEERKLTCSLSRSKKYHI